MAARARLDANVKGPRQREWVHNPAIVSTARDYLVNISCRVIELRRFCRLIDRGSGRVSNSPSQRGNDTANNLRKAKFLMLIFFSKTKTLSLRPSRVPRLAFSVALIAAFASSVILPSRAQAQSVNFVGSQPILAASMPTFGQ